MRQQITEKTLEENREIVCLADDRIKRASEAIRTGKYPKDGITFGSHILGLIGQRLWFYNKTTGYSDKLKISDACVGCGKCAEVCPMRNIGIVNNKAVAGGKCTMCYRCISLCPQKAITLLGKEVTEQCRFEKYNRTP